jgi:hypothetical protein
MPDNDPKSDVSSSVSRRQGLHRGARNMATTEAALMRRGVGQIYLSLGDAAADGTIPVRTDFALRPHIGLNG